MILEAALICLSMNIFHEARGETVIGQYAVAQVTMTRADQDQRNVCRVVHQRKQFSWTNTPRKHPSQIDLDAWIKAMKIARQTLARKMSKDFSKGATHYHAVYVSPYWKKSLRKTVRIGNHIFYG